MYAEALWDHVTMNEEELCFTAGQAIAVYDIDDPEWWFGLADDHIGWFPAAFVRVGLPNSILIHAVSALNYQLSQAWQAVKRNQAGDLSLRRIARI